MKISQEHEATEDQLGNKISEHCDSYFKRVNNNLPQKRKKRKNT